MLVYMLIFGGYILASLIFFKYPTLLHKKKRVKFRCRHISHRGGAGEGYENTINAFKNAVSIGTEMLELDCHLTKDGQVVVSHDNNLSRCTGLDENVTDLNFEDLPLLKERLPLDFDYGTEFIGSGKEEDRRFALLEDVFQTFPLMPVNIDIKINNDELISKVSDLVKRYDREEITIWGNSSNVITSKCYKCNPRINILFSEKRVLSLVIMMFTGLLPFVPLKETHLEIYLPEIYQKGLADHEPSTFNLGKPFLSIMNVLLLRPCLFRHLQARGIHVYLWVLNREEEFRKAFDLQATGVMTDYPTKLRSFLQARNIL